MNAPAKKKLVITADDVGLAPGVNDGMEELIRAGRLRNVSLMATAPAFDRAAAILKEQTQVSCGLHFNLYQGTPLTDSPAMAPLLGPDGSFLRSLPRVVWAIRDTPQMEAAVKREMRAQLETLLATGLKPTHIDVHKFLAYTPVIGWSAQFARENGISFVRWPSEPDRVTKHFSSPLRLLSRAWVSSRFITRFARRIERSLEGVRKTPCTGIFCIGEWTQETMEGILSVARDDALEVVMHPGRTCGELEKDGTRLIAQRERELEILLSDRFGEALDRYGWEIAGFGDI